MTRAWSCCCFRRRRQPRKAIGDRRPAPDSIYVEKELRRRSVTRLLLWEEYRAANPDGSGYTWLCTTCEAWKQRARIRAYVRPIWWGDGVRRFRGRHYQVLNGGRRSVRQAKGDFSLFSGTRQPLGFRDRVEVDNSDVT